jgi:RHS repeat-associated protein
MLATSKYTSFTTASKLTGQFNSKRKGYSFRFNGKENDKEGMGGGGSTYDYGFRIYNAQLGKFLSVDPLTKNFPYFTPYQFAGNKPIIAIDLQGLQPLFLIGTNGKLKDPIITLLNAAFGFNEIVMKQSYWMHYTGATSGIIWYFITGNPTASTSGETIYHDANDHSEAEWFGLIVHEESHRQDIGRLGNFQFYSNYLIEGIGKPYEEISSEKKAYGLGANYKTENDMADALIIYKNGIVMSILKNDKLAENQKSIQLRRIGLEFRLENIINPALAQINNQIQSIQKQIIEYKGDQQGLDMLKNELVHLNTAQKLFTYEKSKIESELNQ